MQQWTNIILSSEELADVDVMVRECGFVVVV